MVVGGDGAQTAEYLSSLQGTLGSMAALPDTMVLAYHLSIWEVEAGESEVKGHPQLHMESEASWGHIRACLKKYDIGLGMNHR